MPRANQVPPTAVYQLKIALRGIRPPIWRRFLVGDNVTLYRLHQIIQIVMGWKDEHLHQFEVGGIRYGEPSIEGFLAIKDERRVKLGQVVTQVKKKFRYDYDFGDGWEHEVEVEEIRPAEPDQPLPLCITGKRACPPENVGGPWGYSALLEAKANPRHPERERFATLIVAYDPQAYDLDATNQALRSMRV